MADEETQEVLAEIRKDLGTLADAVATIGREVSKVASAGRVVAPFNAEAAANGAEGLARKYPH